MAKLIAFCGSPKVYISINSENFIDVSGMKVVQYGDEIGISVSKRAAISFYGNQNTSIFNIHCKKLGISQRYFKEEFY